MLLLRRCSALLIPMALVAMGCTGGPAATGADQQRAVGRAGSEQEPGGNGEAQEESEALQERIEAFKEAKANGTAGVKQGVTNTPAPGWTGERVVDPTKDDWEPAIAADPNGPYVYLLVTRIGEPKPCPGNCPSAYMALERSTDEGATWSAATPLCACKGSWQYDPMIEVVPNTGDVYAAYLNGFTSCS
jgi:hypothetical protein